MATWASTGFVISMDFTSQLSFPGNSPVNFRADAYFPNKDQVLKNISFGWNNNLVGSNEVSSGGESWS